MEKYNSHMFTGEEFTFFLKTCLLVLLSFFAKNFIGGYLKRVECFS